MAFQSVKYPILPQVLQQDEDDRTDKYSNREILHIRHHSLFTPRDFDLSPYFAIVKPELELGFDYKQLNWQKHSEEFTKTGEVSPDSV